ncbi:MAG: Flp pilus assembly complex ATPase component TadA [Nitrospirae bacterium]|nr:Flp pilus assembly complex ATPase component TadA [Nitrospirota bacterium]
MDEPKSAGRVIGAGPERPAGRRRRLGEWLVSLRFVSQEQLEAAVHSRKGESGAGTSTAGAPHADDMRLGERLVKQGVLTEEQLAQALAQQARLAYQPLDQHRFNPADYQWIPVELMYRYPFVPYEASEGSVTIVVSDPTNVQALDELELLLKRQVRLMVSTRTAILDVLKRSESTTQVLKKVGADMGTVLIKEDEAGDEILSVEKITKDTSPVIRLVDSMLLNALQRRASDIHVEATDRSVMVKYRIDGVLYPAMAPLDVQLLPALISRIKVMSDLDIAEKRVPQDGRFKLRLDGRKIDFRVSILPSIFGEDVVIRILDKEYITAGVNELRLDRLGFNPEDLRRFRRAIVEPYGMVLVTGPTGSGKTTTLYAAISEINNKEDKLITIEDPVEYQLDGVVQIPVNEKKGLTFARGLRSILRHDPDKIMVGEIRDAETAQIAIQSALTGHLVFTTVHANNAFDVIGRFVNMGIEPYNFVSSLNCILAQRLVRAICLSCREPATIDPVHCDEAGLTPVMLKTATLFQGRGCHACNGTGFQGRRAITEFLHLSDTVRELILARRPSSELRKQAIAEGMTTLRQAGVEKVLRGETTLREINRVTFIEPL